MTANTGEIARKEPRVHPLVLVLIAVSLGAIGQILLKQGVGGVSLSGGAVDQVRTLFSHLFLPRPTAFFGLVFYVISTVFWLKVLTTQELSYVYPMIAVSYAMVTMLAIMFLHEHVPPLRWVALSVICLGVVMLAILGGPSAKQDKAKAQTTDATSQHTSAAQTPTSPTTRP
jgi:multidrug transporter EmrE-like cation transporter